jgi:catechol 2,3-dioxygenase-like lactoylglutathione lyase family enzyme
MARLRHLAIVVKDLDATAEFYERAFGLKRIEKSESETAHRIFLTDGEINLALLKYKGKRGSGLDDPESFVGLHHMGFQVDDLGESQAAIEKAGGTWYFDLGKEEDEAFERKFRDPNGIVFDISHKGWAGTPSKK